jgi:hypothetical protein
MCVCVQQLAAALEAQKQGQQQMVSVVKQGLEKMIEAEMELRAEEEQANKARLKEEADRCISSVLCNVTYHILNRQVPSALLCELTIAMIFVNLWQAQEDAGC